MTTQLYRNFKKLAYSGAVNFTTQTVKVMLTTNAYVFSHSHTTVSDITSEIVSANYTAGGSALTNVSLNLNTVTNEAYVDANDLTFSSITASPAYAILYLNTANNPLIGQLDLGVQQLSAADLVITWNTEGVVKHT